MTRRPLLVLAALVGALVVLLAGCSSGSGTPKASASGSGLNDQASNTGGKFAGFGLTPPEPRPAFTLTDTSGKPYAFQTETAGHPTFLYFGYTHCPDVCPATMADIGLALKAVPAALRSTVLVVFVTTDVARDTGPVIASWLKYFDVGVAGQFVGLTGSQAQIDAAQAAAKITLATDDGQTHSAQVLLFGADNYARVTYVQSDNETALMTHDLPLVAG